MMREGLLWYDDDPTRDLAGKVSRAAQRYKHKFGMAPNVCYVHPSVMGEGGQAQAVNGVRVDSLMNVLRNHYWLGQEEARPAAVLAN